MGNTPHHSNSCLFCVHWQRGCNIVQDKLSCTVCKDFMQLNGSYIREYHSEWPDQLFFKYRWYITCPCCTIQKELEQREHKHEVPKCVFDEIMKRLEEQSKRTMPAATAVQTQDKKTKEAAGYEKYDRAIKDGAVEMACGRIVTIRTNDVPPGILNRKLGFPSAETKDQCLFVKKGEQFNEMTNDVETKILTQMVNKHIANNGDSAFNRAVNEAKDHIVKVFAEGSKKKIEPKNVRNSLRQVIAEIVVNIKQGVTHQHTAENLPTLLSVTDKCSSKLFWDILPLFITSRSLFILAHGKEKFHDDEVSTEEQLWILIACINGTLSGRAKEIFCKINKVPNESVLSPPYPKIFLAGNLADGPSQNAEQMHCNIKKMLGPYERDRLQILHQMKEKDKLLNFVTDLKIDTPLAWELFRSIFTYATKGFKYIHITEVAAIAVLCEIKNDAESRDLQGVLNFYHEHGAFLYFSDVPYMADFIVLSPDWLYEQYQKLTTFACEDIQSLVDLLKNYGILTLPLCKKVWTPPETEQEYKYLPESLLELLKKKHLAANVSVCEVMGNYKGDAYFVPFVLSSRKDKTNTSTHKTIKVISEAIPLHFIFPDDKYLPPGVFVRFAALLTTKGMEVDFTSGVYCNEISYWYNRKADLITITSTLTSICIRIQRVGLISSEPFESVCLCLLKLFQKALAEALEEFGSITCRPALLSRCSSDPKNYHYAKIDGNVLTCDKGQHEPNPEEKKWLQPLNIDHLVSKFQKFYAQLKDKIHPSHCSNIAAKLYSKERLTIDERNDIENPHTEAHQRVTKLLSAVERSSEMIEKFLEILEEYKEYKELITNIRDIDMDSSL